jgi:hypothetical protein
MVMVMREAKRRASAVVQVLSLGRGAPLVLGMVVLTLWRSLHLTVLVDHAVGGIKHRLL